MFQNNQSKELFLKAQSLIPGGVNSPVRAFKSVSSENEKLIPFFVKRGEGAYLFDVDDNRYVDYICSWGPLIFGHSPEFLKESLYNAIENGTSFGAPTGLEVEFAELISELVPSVEMLRLVSSGTEATMSAVRLARGYTKRNFIIKFNGCYHGHGDSLLVAAGSGAATQGIAGSAGIPKEVANYSISIPFNDIEILEETLKLLGAESVAAIIIEPVPGNMGLILPKDGYLKKIREICDASGIVLIFDEVMSGFRVALGGAQSVYNVSPDLTTFGKVIGGGLPIGAFGGKKKIMECLAPIGNVYQAGTLSGNPLAVSAGLAILKKLKTENPFELLATRASRLVTGLKSEADLNGINLVVSSLGSMFGFFFSKTEVKSFEEAKASNITLFNSFFSKMLNRGVYFAPSAFEAGFLSTCHNDDVIDYTLAQAKEVMKEILNQV